MHDEGDFWEVAGGANAARKAQAKDEASTNVNGANSRANTSAPVDFGGVGMSPEMRTWCTQQMQRIRGSDDITLLEFCMSLDSPLEIRTYLQQYLGAKTEVVNFATEFIRRKAEKEKKGGGGGGGGSSANQSANQSEADKKKKKKGTKGHKVDAGMIGITVHSNRALQGDIDYGDA